ncbi:hypothetical protein Acr_24g0004610 [Actinidia rufa]|uniref:Uncharacterized protein n=1 Tax=Actinidia rufa TaxID=165716 RepID=A0A7J0GU64_9ERIC|nr:hypothetical protein Acr_24g0004610 [Actinidia rufa]
MGQHQSKDELLYQQVNNGNVEGIKALRSEGAGLEVTELSLSILLFDHFHVSGLTKKGETPLIAACMNSELYNVAKTLIELGANVNASRPANTLVMNDDCQTPLDVARVKGCTKVVRAIESHICLFSGWLRELYGPGFLEVLAPQLLSRKVWVVVLPCGSCNLSKPFKLELAIYSGLQDAQPRTLIALWKANLEEPKFNQPDPAVIISDISNKSRIKFAPASETDKQLLQRFCDACKGIPQVLHTNFPFNHPVPVSPATTPSSTEDVELAMAINASIQSAMEARPPYVDADHSSGSKASSNSQSGWGTLAAPAAQTTSSGCEIQEVGPGGNPTQQIQNQSDIPATVQTAPSLPTPASLPSAPPVENLVIYDGPIQYPLVDFSPIDMPSQVVENLPGREDERKEDMDASSSSSYKKWGCPVCRAKIDQVIRLYAV